MREVAPGKYETNGWRVVVVPSWVPLHWVWRSAVVVAVLIPALIVGNVFAWRAAQRNQETACRGFSAAIEAGQRAFPPLPEDAPESVRVWLEEVNASRARNRERDLDRLPDC